MTRLGRAALDGLLDRVVLAAARRARRFPDAVVRGRRYRAIRRAPAPVRDRPRVWYGVDRFEEDVSGGLVKFFRLGDAFPNEPRTFNLLYLGSSSRPPDSTAMIRLARRRGARVVWNQDGVAYPAWAGRSAARRNRPLAAALRAADHVFFQSEFCKLGADRFVGPPAGSWEILYNAVDTTIFTPGTRAQRPLTLLLAGNQYWWYRIETALRTLALVRRERPDARLIVAGRIQTLQHVDGPRETARLTAELGLEDAVELPGPYRQDEAPDLLRRADLLLHTQYNDACPGAVIEALSCGLPVVYSASGGVPELVGEEAGIGVPAPLDFERVHPPDPEALAAAALTVAESLGERSEAARARAVGRFDLRPWVERHRQVFEGLLA